MSDATRDSLRDLPPGYGQGTLSPEEIRTFEPTSTPSGSGNAGGG